jgi:hypothetical protein
MKSCFTTVKFAMFEKLALGLLVILPISFSVENASAFSITGAIKNPAKVKYKKVILCRQTLHRRSK